MSFASFKRFCCYDEDGNARWLPSLLISKRGGLCDYDL